MATENLEPNRQTSVQRAAWHEAGHLAVLYFLCHNAQGAKLEQVGNGSWIGQTTPNSVSHASSKPTKSDDWLKCVAWMHGGRAAIAKALEHKELPLESPGFERNDGDIGFYGDDKSDDAAACLYSTYVSGFDNWKDAYDAGYCLALQTIEDHFDRIRDLARNLARRLYVSPDETKTFLA
jgi:hypothetical protein